MWRAYRISRYTILLNGTPIGDDEVKDDPAQVRSANSTSGSSYEWAEMDGLVLILHPEDRKDITLYVRED